MSRWSRVGGGDASSADSYADRFASLAASGKDVHGEAALVTRLLPRGGRVLDAGCGTGRVAIELSRRGFDVLGVDLDAAMLARARQDAPRQVWMESDLATLDLTSIEPFDLVVAAGNVIALVAEGTEAQVVDRLALALRPGGLLVAGFGLSPAHLPLDHAPVSLDAYDTWCATSGLGLVKRFSTWDGDPYAGGGYAVSIHRREL